MGSAEILAAGPATWGTRHSVHPEPARVRLDPWRRRSQNVAVAHLQMAWREWTASPSVVALRSRRQVLFAGLRLRGLSPSRKRDHAAQRHVSDARYRQRSSQ